MSEQWWVYLLECENGMTYTGTASDVEARFRKHIEGKGSRHTRINKPLGILGAQPFPDRSSACKAEYGLKQQSMAAKLSWTDKWPWQGSHAPTDTD
ncbi:MAG: GIY-YIG nuclease family protein [Candidatus Thiodiazotropha sp.]